MASKEPPPLPDSSTWYPREKARETLEQAFMLRCLAVEERIQLRVQHERGMNVDNFDSGPGVEDIIREELAHLLPTRYSTRAGVLNDSYGYTSGDFDVVIFNSEWVPEIKASATNSSRRVHLPIEGVYAIGEVKQTLGYTTLDQAMKKLVTAHRLHRPPTSASRIVENYELDQCSHGLTNPLYSFIISTGIEDGVTIDDLIRRFVDINKTLRRLEIVRSMCVLGVGTIHWVYFSEDGELQFPLFMGRDLHEELHVGFESVDRIQSVFFAFVRGLMLHLYHSVLAPEDVAAKYGPKENTIQTATSEDLTHDAYSRPVLSPSVPWDYKINCFYTGEVDQTLGAHRDVRESDFPPDNA